MDPIHNPFAPGAGSQPPELAGRQEIISNANIALARILAGRLAMARLGKGPYRSSDVADVLHESVQKLAPCRATIIRKGMIYSPAHGDIDFTVPMFDTYLHRTFPREFVS